MHWCFGFAQLLVVFTFFCCETVQPMSHLCTRDMPANASSAAKSGAKAGKVTSASSSILFVSDVLRPSRSICVLEHFKLPLKCRVLPSLQLHDNVIVPRECIVVSLPVAILLEHFFEARAKSLYPWHRNPIVVGCECPKS